jgi:hypothetical protein
MGWTFFNAGGKPSEIITREFTQTPSDTYPSEFKVLDQSMRGRVWYGVIQSTNPEGIKRVYGMIVLWTLRRGEFGYKELSEDMGPYYYDAPLRIVNLLDRLSPEPSGLSLKWRQSVREYHSRMKVKKVAKNALKISLNTMHERTNHV